MITFVLAECSGLGISFEAVCDGQRGRSTFCRHVVDLEDT